MHPLVTVSLVSLVVCVGCSTLGPTPCISNVNKLIIEFGGVALVPRDTCGSWNGSDQRVEGAVQCFQEGVRSGRSVDYTVNRAIDSVDELSFVWLPDAGLYRRHVTSDGYSPDPDPKRTTVLDRCEGSDLECKAPRRLYTCEEPRSAPRPLLPTSLGGRA